MTGAGRLLTGRSGLLLAIGSIVLGSVLVLVAAAGTWATHTFVTTAGGRQRVVVHGHDVAPSLRALGVAAVVLAVAVIATRSWARRLAGLVIVAVGGATIAVAVDARRDIAATLVHNAFAVDKPVVGNPASAWPWVAIAGGVLVVLGGALTTVVGARWPGLGAKYDAPTRPARDDDDAAWAALDRGDDPTT